MRRRVVGWLALCLVGLIPTREAGADQPVTLSAGLELSQPREDAAPDELGVYEAYQEAQKLEAEIVQMAREIRAAELSRVQRQTLKRSLDSVLLPLSERTEVSPEILQSPATNAEAVGRYQEELAVIMRETDAMVSHARDLWQSLRSEAETAPEAQQKKEDAVPKSEAPSNERAEEKSTKEEIKPEETSREQSAEQSREKDAERKKQRQAERERKKKQVAEAVKKTEFHLERALTEIQAAREEVAKEKEATQKAAEQAEAESEATKQAREKAKHLAELETKIESATKAVGVVLEKVQTLEEAWQADLAKAESAMQTLREAMASVAEADSAAQKTADQAARDKTAGSVREMKAASASMESAVNAIQSLQESSGDGSRNDKIAQMQALGRLAKAASGTWLDLTAQMRGELLAVTPGETPPGARPELWASLEELERSPSARVFSADTPRNVWIFLGDWHVLARYDNEGRANIEKVYPPESILDLSAQYLSEDGQTLRWEYESYLPPMVAPHAWESWKIYYFYTELTFDTETEAWLAIGSDDRSDLWINDLPVWHSANRHKGWFPAEGFRKVVFRAGRNKILLRLENGQAGLGFSLFLNIKQ